MYEQILTNKNGETVKILGVINEIIFISQPNDHTKANGSNYTKEELIKSGWIFPVEKWTPEINDIYYVPNVISDTKYSSFLWTDKNYGNYYLANNLVCRTLEEAIALTDKMLGAVTN